MRKIHIFVETGEVRVPQKGEYVIDNDKDGNVYMVKDEHWFNDYSILTRHVIENDGGINIYCSATLITIPAVKTKVKKWRWAYPVPCDISVS